jgi:hypothetical protein
VTVVGSDVCGHRLFTWLKSSAMFSLEVKVSACCRISNIFAEMFVFAALGQEMCHIYVVISENTLQEMLSNPHEFVSEVGTIVCFGG